MRAKQLLTIAVVSTLLIGGAAALGAASPADQANTNAADAHEDGSGDAADDRADNADGVGPSDLPERVPDHVSQIHDRIDSFLSGSIDNLGESLSGLLGSDEPTDGGAANADGDADA